MARKILGQVRPSATTDTLAYMVPNNTETEVKEIFITNTGGADITFRIRIKANNQTSDNKQYIFYNTTVLAGDTVNITCPITLSVGDSIFVYTSVNTTNFNIFGIEYNI